MGRIGIHSLIVVSCILGAVIFIVSFAKTDLYSEAKTIGIGVRDFKELSNRFEALAEEKGAGYAFTVLSIASLPPGTDLHLLGHVVGDKLYAQQGVDGIATCTQDFRNACSHAVAIGTLTEFGVGALPQIRDACKKAPGGAGAYTMCFHGLGHGVFAYFEYSLPETVDFCRTTGTAEYGYREFSECVSGAIMELMGGGGHDRDLWLAAREEYLNEQKPLEPCTTALIPQEAKAQCLIYLTPRLFELSGMNLGVPDPAFFEKAFSYCDLLPKNEKNLRDACFGGFGKEFVVLTGERDIRNVSAYSDDAFLRAIRWCSFAKNNAGSAACVQDAVGSIFWGGENDPDASFRFCSVVENGGIKKACYDRLANDIASYIKDPERHNALCERIPQESRLHCTLAI